MMRQAATSLAVVLLGGSLASAENLVSGPQVGEGVPGDFIVLFLNGDQAGKRACPVAVKGYDLTALIFASEVSDSLSALMKRIDKRLDEAAGGRPVATTRGVFVVFNRDDPALKRKVEDLIDKEKLKQVVVCFGASEGLEKYEIPEEAKQTVVVFENRSVKANFAFRKDEFTTDWADAILKALGEVLPK